MIEKRLKTRSVNGTLALAETILEIALPTPRLVLLTGEMGAGKTTLVRGMARAVGAAEDEVSSPTFTLVHTYRGPSRTIHHLDLYRLEREEDLTQLGIEELESDPDALVLVEWGEKFPSIARRARGQVLLSRGDAEEERLFFVQML